MSHKKTRQKINASLTRLLRAFLALQRLLDTFLAACKTHGWIKTRGTQRTDSTHVLAAIRRLYYLA